MVAFRGAGFRPSIVVVPYNGRYLDTNQKGLFPHFEKLPHCKDRCQSRILVGSIVGISTIRPGSYHWKAVQ